MAFMAKAPVPQLAAVTHLHHQGQPHWGVLMFRVALLLIAAGGIILLYGFHEPPIPAWRGVPISHALFAVAVHVLQGLALAIYFADTFIRIRRGDGPEAHEGIGGIDWTLLALTVGGVLTGTLHPAGWFLFHGGIVLALVVEFWRFVVTMIRHARPGLVLPVSFLVLIVLGAPLLKLPVALAPGRSLSWLDALFTATSAVCVNGLVVRSTAEHFTPVGQAIIGVLIQLGGLGIVIFGSMIAVLLGRNISLREHLSLSQMMDDLPLPRIRAMVRFIVIATLSIEIIGAALIYALWDSSVTGVHRLGWSVFHSVSAYCNAGFDLTGDSLVSHRYALPTHLVIAPLIVLGGLGFPVMVNLLDVARCRFARWRRPVRPGSIAQVDLVRQRLSLHTKIVLTTTAALYVAGVVAIAAGQLMPHFHAALNQGQTAHVDRPGPLDGGAVLGIVADASFQSITARSGGYASMPMDELQPAGRFALTSLMLVGGSPGGTAGGVKTTVVAVLLLSVFATVRQRETEAFGRAISDSLVRKAGTVLIGYVALAVLGTLLLTLSEPFPFEKLFFEAISAVATVGLSLGITPELTTFGKSVIIALMFLGRVGPLALLGAVLVSNSAPRRPYRYAHESVALG